MDDKRQVTVVVGSTLGGMMLPFQVSPVEVPWTIWSMCQVPWTLCSHVPQVSSDNCRHVPKCLGHIADMCPSAWTHCKHVPKCFLLLSQVIYEGKTRQCHS